MFLLLLQTIESEDDRAFLEQLFDTHYVRLCKKAAAITQNNQVSEDLVQDVFLYVVKHIQKFRQMDCCTLRHILDTDYSHCYYCRMKRSLITTWNRNSVRSLLEHCYSSYKVHAGRLSGCCYPPLPRTSILHMPHRLSFTMS